MNRTIRKTLLRFSSNDRLTAVKKPYFLMTDLAVCWTPILRRRPRGAASPHGQDPAVRSTSKRSSLPEFFWMTSRNW